MRSGARRPAGMAPAVLGDLPIPARGAKPDWQGTTGREARSRLRQANSADTKRKTLPWPVFLFLVSLLIPWIIIIGPMRLSVYRFVLLIWLFPCLLMLITGKAGRIRVADISLLLYCLWCFLAISMVHGLSYAVQPAGMIFIETMGAYLFARCFIRDADDFHNMVLLLFRLIAFLLPFAIFETVTRHNILLEALSHVYQTFPDADSEPRWGLRRVQTIFEHPILFGVACASAFSLTNRPMMTGVNVRESP